MGACVPMFCPGTPSGKELVGHSISIYRSGFGIPKIANVTSYDE